MPSVKLTPAFVKNQLQCPPGKRKIEYCDTAFPGLYVEVRATSPGQGTYYLRYKNQRATTRHVKIGRSTELTLTQARKKAKEIKAEVVLGADPQAERRRKRTIPTFAQFAHEQYLPYTKPRKRSWKTDVSILNNHLLPMFGEYPLDEISRPQISAFHTSVRATGLAPATCDLFLIVLRRMLNLAVEWEILSRNPASKIEMFNVDNRKERYLTDAEMKRLLQILKTDNNRPVCLVILFLLSTGARVQEALKACWEYIDLDKRVWRIPSINSKSKRPRVVPLNDMALNVLNACKKMNPDTAHVFISGHTGKPLTNIRMIWYRLREAAGLDDFRIHDCRHNFASTLVNSGRSLYEVQQILGHHDPKVTMRYSHLSTDALQAAASSASSVLGTLDLEEKDSNALYRPSSHKADVA